jgi:hypothetical protein
MRTLFLLLASLVVPATVAAQNAVPACDGRLAIVRLSEITPTGTAAGFMKAVAAHKEWYASHGLKDEIFSARIIVRDETTHAASYSEKQFLTFHIFPSNTPAQEPTHDAAWDAYVKIYRENSEIKTSYQICMPDPGKR